MGNRGGTNEEPDTFLQKMDCQYVADSYCRQHNLPSSAMAQPDRQEFIKAMAKDIATQEKIKHWVITPIEEVAT